MRFTLSLLLLLLFQTRLAGASEEATCKLSEAQTFLSAGMRHQAELETEEAKRAYEKCIELEAECVACRYEIGWSYWKLGQWEKVVATWEKTIELDSKHVRAREFLPTAKENLLLVRSNKISSAFRTQVELATRSLPNDGPLEIFFTSRRQSYNSKTDNPLDIYDPEIQSPKSVKFTLDGKKVYLNSLEGSKTLVLDPTGTQKFSAIHHKFPSPEVQVDTQKVFDYRFEAPQKASTPFVGKPVELEWTHQGRYLWTPYYRRSFDKRGTQPSAMAIIDTQTQKIVRVMGVGPISKYVKASPKGSWMAVSHWGDNTVGLIDIRAKSPKKFKLRHHLIVEKRLPLKGFLGDRDHDCGFCVRGLAFTPDEKYLLVTRMKGGGIAVFDLRPPKNKPPVYLGTVFGVLPGPRDIDLAQDGKSFYVSCNASGYVARLPFEPMLAALQKIEPTAVKRSVRLKAEEWGAQKVFVGLGARSIRLSPDEKYLFVAVNSTSELVGVSTSEMKVEARIPVDSYPVGLDISPDGGQLWVTSQGQDAKGGNSVGIFEVRYRNSEVIKKSKPSSSESGP